MDDARKLYSLDDVCSLTGLSRRAINGAVAQFADSSATSDNTTGLRAIKIGRRTFITPFDLERWIGSQPTFTRAKKATAASTGRNHVGATA